MYKKILIALDNSEDSNAGVDLGVTIARSNNARLTGLHAYAARLHDERFAQMESALPARYQTPGELKRQRVTHEGLIERGLKAIADSYSIELVKKANVVGLGAEGMAREGKNYAQILSEVREGSHDLLVLGRTGLGSVKRTTIGSVSERVARRVRVDMLVARAGLAEANRVIIVGMDGSPASFGALASAVRFGHIFNAKVEAVSVFDADFHYRAFKSLAKMLPEETRAAFDFQAQEKLHEKIIDNGLKAIYSDHLEGARRLAVLEGVEIETKLLSGKPFDAILERAIEVKPFMLALGRTGYHADLALDIGSNAENVLRNAPCHVFISTREALAPRKPRDFSDPAPSVKWSLDALALLDRIPAFARETARRLIEKRAGESNVALITIEYMRAVREELGMPDVKGKNTNDDI